MVAVTAAAVVLGAAGWVSALIGLLVFVAAFLAIGRGGAHGARERVVADGATIDRGEVVREIAAAEGILSEIDAAAGRLAPRGLDAPLTALTADARAILDHIAADPDDLRRARRFFKTYLPSARDSVTKFEALDVVDAELDARFRTLIGDVRKTCADVAARLRSDDQTELEIEMEVLSERLSRENR